MRKIQSFLGLENEISRDSFIIPKNEDGSDGTPCYIEDDQTEANCIGKGSSEKGRSLDKNFSLDVAKVSKIWKYKYLYKGLQNKICNFDFFFQRIF